MERPFPPDSEEPAKVLCLVYHEDATLDAIRVAARMPPARIGSIEVRPLKEIGPR